MMMVVMFVPAVGGAFVVVFVVIMPVAMIVSVIVVVSCIGVLFGQELGVDVQNGVQVEAADIQHGFYVGFAEMHRVDGRTRVDLHQARDRKSTRLNSSH